MMRQKKSGFGFAGHFVAAILMVCGALAVLSACARQDVSALADRKPALALEEFFAGPSIAYGIFEDRFGNLRRQFKVNLMGTIEGNRLTLEEAFVYDDGERDARTWVIEKTGHDDDGMMTYTGVAADVTGRAEGRIAGNGLNWQYDVVLEMSGREIEVHFDDWIYRQDEEVAINRAYISKFGLEIGSVTIVFLRGRAADAIGPLNLEQWDN